MIEIESVRDAETGKVIFSTNDKLSLLPCPCCGEKKEILYYPIGNRTQVECLKCGLKTNLFPSKELAQEAWNNGRKS